MKNMMLLQKVLEIGIPFKLVLKDFLFLLTPSMLNHFFFCSCKLNCCYVAFSLETWPTECTVHSALPFFCDVVSVVCLLAARLSSPLHLHPFGWCSCEMCHKSDMKWAPPMQKTGSGH